MHDGPGSTPGESAKSASGHRWRRAVSVLAGVAIAGLVFAYLLPKIANYGAVWGVVESLSWLWAVALVAAATLNVLSDAPPWMTVLPGLGFLNALRMDLAGSALSQIAPGGAAVNAATQVGMLRSWGFDGSPVALAVSLTTIWNQLFVFGSPIVAVVGLAVEGSHDSALEWVAIAGLVLFAAIVVGFAIGLSSKRLAKRLGDAAASAGTWLTRLLHRRPVTWGGEDFVSFRNEAIGLLRRSWGSLTIATLANQLAVFLVLVVSLRAVGITSAQVSFVQAFAAWTLIRALGSIPITPGGIGVEEIALTGGLVGFGAHNAEAVAATLVYRFLTVVPTVVLGLASVATYNLGRPKQELDRTVTR